MRSKPGPGCLHSHSAVKLDNLMVLFGGEREGQTVNEVWRFHFGEFTNNSIVTQLHRQIHREIHTLLHKQIFREIHTLLQSGYTERYTHYTLL